MKLSVSSNHDCGQQATLVVFVTTGTTDISSDVSYYRDLRITFAPILLYGS